MAQIVVRQIDERVKAGLKRRAAAHGRSMEEEVREILSNAVREGCRPPTLLGSRAADHFRGLGLQAELPELHGQEAEAVRFDR